MFASSDSRPSAARSKPSEQKRYEALLNTEKDFLKGAQLVVEAMLQSSSFLFRLDETSDSKWKPYVTASRPVLCDLGQHAGCGVVRSGCAGRTRHCRKASKRPRGACSIIPRAKESLNEFVSQWMRFDRILTASKDKRNFPQFTRETAVAMTQEAQAFVGDLVWNDRNFMELFTADYGFANGDLAGIYGVKAPAKEFDRVAFPAGSERAGLLGQTLFLASPPSPTIRLRRRAGSSSGSSFSASMCRSRRPA